MDIYEARWQNAKRIAERIIGMQENGWLIFDNNNNLIGKVEINKDAWDTESIIEFGGNIRDYWFMNDKHFDEGLYTTIEEYNKKFLDWKCIDPAHIVPLLLE